MAKIGQHPVASLTETVKMHIYTQRLFILTLIQVYYHPLKGSSSYKLMFRKNSVFGHFDRIRPTSDGEFDRTEKVHIYSPTPLILTLIQPNSVNRNSMTFHSKVLAHLGLCLAKLLFWGILAEFGQFPVANRAETAKRHICTPRHFI